MFPSHWEILVIFLVVLLLFGARRIPEMAQGLGKGIREFRKAVKDVQEEVDVTGTMNTTQTIPPQAGPVARQEPTQTAAQAQAPAQAAPAQPVAAPPAAEAPAPTETDNSSGARS